MEKQQFESDGALIQQLQKGNNAAFGIILNHYQRQIHGAILRRMKDPDLAKDLTQDTFIKAYKHLRENAKPHDTTGNLHNWLQKMAHSICIDYFRKAKPRLLMIPIGHLTADDDIIVGQQYHQESFEELEAVAERQTLTRTCIQKLPDDLKELILMRIYGRLKFREIAALSGVCLNTIMGRMRYALKRLRREMEKAETAPLRIAS